VGCSNLAGSQVSHIYAPSPMAELMFIGYHRSRDLVVAKLSEHTGTAWY
jgi:hypothetical protein